MGADVPMSDTITSAELAEDNHDPDVASQTSGVAQGLDMGSQTTGVEHGQDINDGNDINDDNNTTSEYDSTEEAEYEKAELLGIESAQDEKVPLPKRTRKKKADEIYEYYNAMFAGIDVGQVFSSYDGDHADQVFSFLTD